MDRIQFACLCLIASACVLAGLLVTQLRPSDAQAVVTNSAGRFRFMTAQTKSGEDSLFVIDEHNEKLLIYKPNLALPPTGRVELMRAFDLVKLFAGPSKPDKARP